MMRAVARRTRSCVSSSASRDHARNSTTAGRRHAGGGTGAGRCARHRQSTVRRRGILRHRPRCAGRAGDRLLRIDRVQHKIRDQSGYRPPGRSRISIHRHMFAAPQNRQQPVAKVSRACHHAQTPALRRCGPARQQGIPGGVPSPKSTPANHANFCLFHGNPPTKAPTSRCLPSLSWHSRRDFLLGIHRDHPAEAHVLWRCFSTGRFH